MYDSAEEETWAELGKTKSCNLCYSCLLTELTLLQDASVFKNLTQDQKFCLKEKPLMKIIFIILKLILNYFKHKQNFQRKLKLTWTVMTPVSFEFFVLKFSQRKYRNFVVPGIILWYMIKSTVLLVCKAFRCLNRPVHNISSAVKILVRARGDG